jgi:hypothetical protein
VDSVGGVTGPQNVTNMRKGHFEKLYSSSAGAKYRNIFEEKLEAFSFDNLIRSFLLLWIMWLP